MNPLEKDIGLLAYFRSRFWIWCFNKMPNHGSFDGLRNSFLKLSGVRIDHKVKVFAPISLSPKTKTRNISLNGFLFINAGARFSAPGNAKITINRRCLIGPNVNFETVNHGLHFKDNESRGSKLGNITLGEGVWIGANAMVLRNVVINKGAVVAAASVVNKSVERDTVVGGVPAKFIKRTNES